jgi:hypothetical protein
MVEAPFCGEDNLISIYYPVHQGRTDSTMKVDTAENQLPYIGRLVENPAQM